MPVGNQTFFEGITFWLKFKPRSRIRSTWASIVWRLF